MDVYDIVLATTVFTSIFIFYLAFRVGQARRKHKVAPWEQTKEMEVLIANRVHMNTIENSIVFLPLLWVATWYGPEKAAALVGVVWFISRVSFAMAYTKDPSKRALPFQISAACIAVVFLLSLYGIIM